MPSTKMPEPSWRRFNPDPPLGDVRWLTDRPVTITRDDKKITGPILKLGYLTFEEIEDMADKKERDGVVSVLFSENGVHIDHLSGRYTFDEEF